MATQIGPTMPATPLTFAKELGKYAKTHGLAAITYASPKLRQEFAKDFGVLWPKFVDGTVKNKAIRSTFTRLNKKWGGYLTGVQKYIDPGSATGKAVAAQGAATSATAARYAAAAGAPPVAGAAPAIAGGMAIPPGAPLPQQPLGAQGAAQRAGAASRRIDSTMAASKQGLLGKLWHGKKAGPFLQMGLALALSYAFSRLYDQFDIGGTAKAEMAAGERMAGMEAGILPGETAEQSGMADYQSRLIPLLEAQVAGGGSPAGINLATMGGGMRVSGASDDLPLGGEGRGGEEAALIQMLQQMGA